MTEEELKEAKKYFCESLPKVKVSSAGVKYSRENKLTEDPLNFVVAGAPYYSAGEAFPHLPEGSVCLLHFECDNEFDPDAIAIYSITGLKLGYVPARLNLLVGKYMRNCSVSAFVSSSELKYHDEDKKRFLIRIRLEVGGLRHESD